MSAGISANPAPSCVPDALPVRARRLLKVGGVTPFSATDYPGQLATVIFVQGCPWRCGYCHNPHLHLRTAQSVLHWPKILALLQRRVGLIDAVVFSGGEAATDPALAEAIHAVRALGFRIGLHSAGTYPQRLAELLPLLDWIGLDIKAPFEHYQRITGFADSGRAARASLDAVLASGIDYECRTTLHPALLPENEILELAQALAALQVQNYALQVFRAQGCNDAALNAASMLNYPAEGLVQRVSALFPKFTLRPA
jgi:pyruvate formate lyase activating enzyme